MPVQRLRIDIEFVQDLPRNAASQHVVGTVVDLAHAFGCHTVAQDVEDDETLDLLRRYGVDFAQGYGIGRPAPVDDVRGAGAVRALRRPEAAVLSRSRGNYSK